MSRFLLALVALAALCTSLFAEDAKPASKLGDGIDVPSNIGFSTNISPDKQAATILFDNLWVDIEPAQKGARGTLGQTAIATKVFTLHVPYSTDQRSVTMTMDLRGFAHAEQGVDVRLVACVGDATKVVDLSAKDGEAIKLKGKSKAAAAAEHPAMQSGNFQDRIKFTVQTRASKPVCQITLFLLVEHDTDDSGGALLAVDSLDLEIAKASQGTYKK